MCSGPPPPAAHELELPPCTREDRWVALSSVETLCYQQSKRAFCDAAYQLAQHQGAVAANVSGAGRARVCCCCLRMRQQ
jgi:hypothetical protein